jgi:hypothetical protein
MNSSRIRGNESVGQPTLSALIDGAAVGRALLLVLVAVLLTAAVCTVVFACQYALMLFDDWIHERAECRRLDAALRAELDAAGLYPLRGAP